MNFISFKNFLNNNGIMLFDAQYRIVYHRYNILNNITGKDIVKNMNSNMLNYYVDSLLTKNFAKINHIIERLQ